MTSINNGLITPVPSLSTQGWITDTSNKFNTLLSNFLVTDGNQSYFYKGRLTSLPKIMEENGNDPGSLVSALQTKLTTYFSRYYTSVDVSVSIADEDTNLGTSITLNLNIGINDQGNQRVFGSVLETANGKLLNIIKKNNFG